VLSDLAAHHAGTGQESEFKVELTLHHPASYPRFLLGEGEHMSDDGPSERPHPKGAGKIPMRTDTARLLESLGRLSSFPSATESATATRRDPRLEDLDVSYWVSSPVPNRVASLVMSLYLDAIHPLVGSFDPDLFINDLISHRHLHCSRLLVIAVIYLGCVSFALLGVLGSADMLMGYHS